MARSKIQDAVSDNASLRGTRQTDLTATVSRVANPKRDVKPICSLSPDRLSNVPTILSHRAFSLMNARKVGRDRRPIRVRTTRLLGGQYPQATVTTAGKDSGGRAGTRANGERNHPMSKRESKEVRRLLESLSPAERGRLLLRLRLGPKVELPPVISSGTAGRQD